MTGQERREDQGYLIPDPIDPESLECFRVYVPAHTWYIGAFWAAYEFFTTWLAWARDPLHRGKIAALVWRKAFDKARAEYESGQGCEVNVTGIRQDPLNPCHLEATFDGGVTWSLVADLSKCGGCGGCGGCNCILRFNGEDIQRWDDCENEWINTAPDSSFGESLKQKKVFVDLLTGDCLSAANAEAYIDNLITKLLTTYIDGMDMIDYVTFATALFAWLVPEFQPISLIWGLILFMKDYNNTQLQGWLDHEIKPDLKCLLNKAYTPEGIMPGTSYNTLMAMIKSKKESYGPGAGFGVWHCVEDIARYMGAVGFNRAAQAALITEADCSDCGWREVFDFTTGKQGWAGGIDAGNLYGVYSSGQGWREQLNNVFDHANREIRITRGFVATAIEMIRVEYDMVVDQVGFAGNVAIFDSGSLLADQPSSTGANQSLVWIGSSSMTMIQFRGEVGDLYPYVDPGGSITVKRITVEGSGNNPFG